MSKPSVRVLAVGSFAISVALSLAAFVYMVLAWREPILPTEFGVKGYGIAFSLVMGGVGLVVALRRPSNAIGWVFCGLGLISGAMALGTEFARWSLIVQANGSTAGVYSAWLQEWLWIPLVSGIGVVAAIFPDGRFISKRWRVIMLVAILLAMIPATLSALVSPLSIFEGFENPVVSPGVSLEIASATIVLILPVLLLGTAAAFVRFRRSRGDERQQLKWLVLAASLVASVIVFYGAVAAITGAGNIDSVVDPERLNVAEYLAAVSFLGVPISVAFGVMKYRLYDIDIVINKAVVYGAAERPLARGASCLAATTRGRAGRGAPAHRTQYP